MNVFEIFSSLKFALGFSVFAVVFAVIMKNRVKGTKGSRKNKPAVSVELAYTFMMILLRLLVVFVFVLDFMFTSYWRIFTQKRIETVESACGITVDDSLHLKQYTDCYRGPNKTNGVVLMFESDIGSVAFLEHNLRGEPKGFTLDGAAVRCSCGPDEEPIEAEKRLFERKAESAETAGYKYIYKNISYNIVFRQENGKYTVKLYNE